MFLLAPYFWGPLLVLIILYFGGQISWALSSFFLLAPSFYQSEVQILFFLALFLVSFSILLFSFYYFSSGSDYTFFMGLLFSFILSMGALIFHKGALILFLGWDGLGVTSYLLVLYYLNSKSTSGAVTTVMTNRLGDVFLFIFIVSVTLGSSISFSLSLLSIFVVLCSFTKSAQAPFSSWLPMAMSAPTPVSSLVHSSTLVTAGLYLLMKYYFFWGSGAFLSIILMFGAITMFVASSMALAEKDFKKIIALSTLSQLGFMMSGMGLGCLSLSFFHLITHAFFKSCMFVQVGGMILVNNTSQDGRSYSFSGSSTMLVALGISSLSLCGFPFLSGFFSKDLILGGVLGPSFKVLSFFLLLLGVFLTFLYSLRIMIFSVVAAPQPSFKLVLSKNYASSSLFLVLLGIGSGYLLFSWFFTPPLFLMGLEKTVPIFFWVLLFSFPFFLVKNFEQWGGMAFQDFGVLNVQKLLLSSTKLVESFQLKGISNFSGVFGGFSSNSLQLLGTPVLILGFLLFLLLVFSLGVKHIFLPKSSQ